MSYSIEVVGLSRLVHGLEGVDAILNAQMETATRDAAFLVEADVKSHTPRVTGRLFSSITSRVRPLARGVEGVVGTNVSYARFVEFGRGPIEAAPGHALRFKIGGRTIYRTRVGAAKGRFYFKKGVEQAAPAVRSFFSVAVRNTLRLLKAGI